MAADGFLGGNGLIGGRTPDFFGMPPKMRPQTGELKLCCPCKRRARIQVQHQLFKLERCAPAGSLGIRA
jgi:hypothetical protein